MITNTVVLVWGVHLVLRGVRRDRPPPAAEAEDGRYEKRGGGGVGGEPYWPGCWGEPSSMLCPTGQGLDGTGLGVAAEQDVGGAGQLSGRNHTWLLEQAEVAGHHAALRHEGDPRSGRQVQTGFDDAVVTQRDPEPRVRPQQAVLAQGHALAPAAGEHAHRGGAAADVGAVTDDDPLGDAALNHGTPNVPAL